MKVILRNYDTKETIGSLSVKKLDRLFDITKAISEEQEKADFLGLGSTCRVTDAGIKSYCTCGAVMSNDPNEVENATVRHDQNGTLIGSSVGSLRTDIKTPNPVKIRKDGESQETTLRLLVTAYPEGYVLDVGKTSANIFGVRGHLYLSNIGRKNVKFGGLGACHIFPTLKNMLDYIEKHRSVFNYLVDNGYSFSVYPVCSQFASSMDEIPAKDEKYAKKLHELLDEINAYESEPEENFTLTGIASPEEMKQEAISRLLKFGVWKPVVENFRKEDKIYMSEFGGIIYDANEETKKALENVRDDNKLPYAVIRSQTTIGDMYCVLYVSEEKECWERERADRNGFCEAYVYNASEPMFSEYGEVQIQGENGGLARLS